MYSESFYDIIKGYNKNNRIKQQLTASSCKSKSSMRMHNIGYMKNIFYHFILLVGDSLSLYIILRQYNILLSFSLQLCKLNLERQIEKRAEVGPRKG